MRKTVAVGVIGCGRVGRQAHLACYATNRRAKIVAVADTNAEVARAAAAEYHVPHWYADVDAFLADPAVEAVSIATYHPSHGPLAARAAAAGKHVLVEKPLATCRADAMAAVAAARAAGVVLTVGYQPRFQFQWQKVHEIIEAGAIGRPHEATVVTGLWHRADPSHRWLYDRSKAGGGVLLDLASYTVYSLVYWLGPVRSVAAHTAVWVPERSLDGQRTPVSVEDVGALMLLFERGTIGLVYTSWSSPTRHNFFEIVGDRGRIGIGKEPGGRAAIELYTERDDLSPAIPHGFSAIMLPQEDNRDAHRAKIDDFLGAIIERREPAVRAEDAAHAIEVLDAAYRSSAEDRIVHLPLTD